MSDFAKRYSSDHRQKPKTTDIEKYLSTYLSPDKL